MGFLADLLSDLFDIVGEPEEISVKTSKGEINSNKTRTRIDIKHNPNLGGYINSEAPYNKIQQEDEEDVDDNDDDEDLDFKDVELPNTKPKKKYIP